MLGFPNKLMGFPTKNDHFAVFWGYPPFLETPISTYPTKQTGSSENHQLESDGDGKGYVIVAWRVVFPSFS